MATKKTTKFQPQCEGLEGRSLLTGCSAVLNSTNGVLYVYGTNDADHILITQDGAKINLNDGISIRSFDLSQVKGIMVGAGAGDDRVVLSANDVQAVRVPSYLYGQGGNDILVGGQGLDVIRGGDGNDLLAGMKGGDALFGDGGSDILLGGEGDDALWGGNSTSLYLETNLLDGGPGYDALHGDDVLGFATVANTYYDDSHGAALYRGMTEYSPRIKVGHLSSQEINGYSLYFGILKPPLTEAQANALAQAQAVMDWVNGQVSPILRSVYGDLTPTMLNNDFGTMVLNGLLKK